MLEELKKIRKLFKYLSAILLASIVFVTLQAGSYYKLSNFYGEYILSSITQGFASLFALIFVIIFFICQSTKRFSTLSEILIPDGNFLIMSFICATLLPLIALKFADSIYFNVLINISISLALLCFFLLWIFIFEVNLKIKHYGSQYILSTLKNLELPKEKEKYIELIMDLKEMGPQTLFESCSGPIPFFIIDLTELAENQNDSDILGILSQILYNIILYAGKKGKSDEILPLFELFINSSLIGNLSEEKSLDIFSIAINLQEKFLSFFRTEKDKFKEDIINFAKNILFVLFSLSNQKEQKLRSNRKISTDLDLRYEFIKSHIISTVKNNLITEEEYWEAYKEKFSSLDKTALEDFKSYLKELFKKAKSNKKHKNAILYK